MKGIKSKFSLRHNFYTSKHLKNTTLTKLELTFVSQSENKSPLLLEHIARAGSAVVLVGRLGCSWVYLFGDHCMVCTTTNEECFAKAGTDTPSLPETAIQSSTTANETHQTHLGHVKSKCFKIFRESFKLGKYALLRLKLLTRSQEFSIFIV